MRKIIAILSFLFSVLCSLYSLACAQDENITITTYYPSPFGSYNELAAVRMKIGTNYSLATTAVANNNLIVEGDVGIGTAAPNTRLVVADDGGVDQRATVRILNTRTTGSRSSRLLFSGGYGGNPPGSGNMFEITTDMNRTGNQNLYIWDNEAGATRLLINDAGNVGIGTTSPKAPLTIKHTGGSDKPSIILDDQSSPEILFGTGPTHRNWRIAVQEDVGDAFEIAAGNIDGDVSDDVGTAWKTHFVVKGNGNVGIGTTAPGAKLEVAGDAKITGGLKPDYDSGWYSEYHSPSHERTLNHNLGVYPSRYMIFFSPNNPPTGWIYAMEAGSQYVNNSGNEYEQPISGLRFSTTQVNYYIYNGTWLCKWYNGAWLVWTTGYYRVLLWK